MSSTNNFMYVDAHCHCPDYDVSELEKFMNMGILLISVSEDWNTVKKNLFLKEKYGDRIHVCIGIHPWTVEKYSIRDAERIIQIAVEENIKCLGEIGLDTRFVPGTIERQREFFHLFLSAAREYGFSVNLHTPGTWREVYELLIRYDIGRAYFHWYTGPLNLLEAIASTGYFIGANPAWRLQVKHRRILEEAPLDVLITESDGPYKYRNMELSPTMVINTIDYLAEQRGISRDVVAEKVFSNAKKFLGFG